MWISLYLSCLVLISSIWGGGEYHKIWKMFSFSLQVLALSHSLSSVSLRTPVWFPHSAFHVSLPIFLYLLWKALCCILGSLFRYICQWMNSFCSHWVCNFNDYTHIYHIYIHTYVFLEVLLVLFQISLTPFDSIFLICYIFESVFNLKTFKTYVFYNMYWKTLLSKLLLALFHCSFSVYSHSWCLVSLYFLFLVIVDYEFIFSTS